LGISAGQNGYEFEILSCAMKGLIAALGWALPFAFDAGCSRRRSLVFQQLPV
jgi:hypothetical protein